MKYALESQYIHEMTPFYCPIFNKERAHEIFLKFKLQIMQFTHQPKTSFLIFRIYKIFFYLLSFANFSSSEFAFASYSRTKHFQCFFFQQSKQIKHFKTSSNICTHRQCAEAEFRLYLAMLCSRVKHCTTASLKKIPPLKVDVLNT